MTTYSPPENAPTDLRRAADRAAWITASGASLTVGLYIWLAWPGREWQLLAGLATNLLLALMGGAALLLNRRGRTNLGIWLIVLAGVLDFVLGTALFTNLGVALGAGVAVLAIIISSETLSSESATWAQLLGLTAGAACVGLDLWAPRWRLAAPPLLATGLPVLVAGVTIVYGALAARQITGLTLRFKLTIAFLAVTLIPVAVLSYFNYDANRRALTNATNQSLLAAASQTAAALDAFININKEVVASEARSRDLVDYLSLPPEQRAATDERSVAQAAAVRAVLEEFRTKGRRNPTVQSEYRQIQSYWLLDNQGRVLASAPRLGSAGLDRSTSSYFQNAMRSAETYVSPVEFSADTNQAELFFAAAVRAGPNQAPLGVLVARYGAGVLQSSLASASGYAGELSYPTLFDENLMILSHGQSTNLVYKLTGSADEARLRQLIKDRRLPDLDPAELSANLPALESNLLLADRRPFFQAAASAANGALSQVAVKFMQTQPWRVAYIQPTNIFLAPAARQTRFTIQLALLLALAATGAGIFLTQALAEPITQLAAVARRVTGGDLEARARVQSDDEIGTLALAFNQMVGQLRDLYRDLEGKVEARTRHLEAAAEVGRAATSILNLEALLTRALELTRERFGYYHASIFLLDEAGEYAVLRESTGRVGALLKERGHKLKVGSTSIIGWVTANRQPRVVADVETDRTHLPNELLLGTRSEAALPLIIGDRLIGALDVQSTQANAFPPADIETLKIMADQLAIAIENGRLFTRQQRLVELEQLMAGFSARIHQTVNVDIILETAAAELGRALGAHRAVVSLRGPAEGNGRGNGHASQEDAP